MAEWAAAARAALAVGPAALVTILATEGSAPRGPGTRMLVTRERFDGTIGGGALEHRAIEQGRAILDHPAGSWRVQDYPLGPLLGQCCGGRVRLLIERLGEANWLDAIDKGDPVEARLQDDHIDRAPAPPSAAIRPPHWAPASAGPGTIAARGPLLKSGDSFVEPLDRPRRRLTMFGAGHVGRAIARVMPGLPFQLAWYDSRPEAGEQPGVVLASEDDLVACAGEASEATAVLILTHDHALDYRLTAAALRSGASFVGLIGSRTKRARFLSRLTADRIDTARLTCPIGLPGIEGKEPEVIAIAAMAQLLAL
ncbi:xanthine dehydrogenase accessory protein XdhC [Sphingomonas sp. MMS24-J13]|uniref:xanthine dehydrogenase accessory protein XdhC n=1 Tax=Sphingomonas sp. MMS24-J13 TaxID=3238686 RepID=UPI003850D5CE